jgi:hypothetical protein
MRALATEPAAAAPVKLLMKLSHLLSRTAAAAISVALIACADPAEPPPDPDAAAQVGEAEKLPQTLPPPSETTPRYVGLWATTAEGCSNPAWRFEERHVSTQGEVSCNFEHVEMTSTGYTAAATCHAEGDTTTHNIQLSFAESARAMMIAEGPWAATSLVYCGPLAPN